MASIRIPLLLLLFFFLHQPLSSSLSDSDALLLLKSSFINPDPALSSWTIPALPSSDQSSSSTPACAASWTGVLCFQGLIVSLRLGGLRLSGTIDVSALSHLRALRSLSFDDNNLTGPLPDIGRLDALKSVYLSNNRFSGGVNDSMFSNMDHLKKLWLDGNDLSGKIPFSLSKAAALIELRLEGNAFTGEIPDLKLPSLRSFNVSGNNLQGRIPASLAHFDVSAFTGNPKLCGPPLAGPPCPILNPANPAPHPGPTTKSNLGKAALLVFGMLLLILSLVISYAAVKTRHQPDYSEPPADHDTADIAEAMAAAAAASPVQLPASASSRSSQGKQQQRGKSGRAGAELVMVNDEKGVFDMADLMRAAAELVGDGGVGSVYKAVMGNGAAVAVKKMREMNRLNKEGFDREMRRLGRLRHPNLLTPLAYHIRKEERLVITEFIPKGSLLYILHGDKEGPDHAAINFPARLKIIRGMASGMSYLHAQLPSYDLPHGNLKTSNILLRPDFHPLLADYGFASLVNSSPTISSFLFAYKSPESPNISPKSDVFCFGLVLLEILTAKFPSQYLHNTNGGTDVVHLAASAVSAQCEFDIIDPQIASGSSEAVRLLRLGVACTRSEPDDRPGMKEAADLVEEIAATFDAVGPVGPVPTWRDGYAQLSGSLRGRSEGSGKGTAKWPTGDLFSL